MTTCAAFGCKNRQSNKISGITFHSFPRDPKRRTAWMRAVRRRNWTPSKRAKLCSLHFLEDDFDRTSFAVVRLRTDAVPCIFSAYPPDVQVKCLQERKKQILDRTAKEAEFRREVQTSSNSSSSGVPSKSTDTGENPQGSLAREVILDACGYAIKEEKLRERLRMAITLNKSYEVRIKELEQERQRHEEKLAKLKRFLAKLKKGTLVYTTS